MSPRIPSIGPWGARRLAGTELGVSEAHRAGPQPWVYVGTYPTDPFTRGDSPPWENGVDHALGDFDRVRFRWDEAGRLEIDGVPDISAAPPPVDAWTMQPEYVPELNDIVKLGHGWNGAALIPIRYRVAVNTGVVTIESLVQTGAMPAAYGVIPPFTAVDGTDYAMTGLDTFFVGPDNSEGILTGLDPIVLVNDDGTFTVDEALETNLPGIYLWDFYVEFEDAGLFPAGIRVDMYLESGSIAGPGPFSQGNRANVVLPTTEAFYSLLLPGMGLITSATGNGEFVVSVQTVGGDVECNGGGFIVTRLTSVPLGL